MHLENVVFDALDPQRLGPFWEAVVDGEQLTDEPAGYETRLAVDGGPVLDLCFQRVDERASMPARLRLHLLDEGSTVVDRVLGLGARHLGVGRGDVTGELFADPEGNPFVMTPPGSTYVDTGPLAKLSLESADPDRDGDLWSWLTGWADASLAGSRALRHPSGRGPLLELCPERATKGGAKSRIHLDVRLAADDDPDRVAAGISERGGRELHPGWGDLPWRHYADPSGNEFCVLPAPSARG